MSKYITIILLIIICSLQYKLLHGEGSISHYRTLKQELTMLQRNNQKLTARNQFMAHEIDDLKNKLDAIEERARVELRLIKQNEIFYRILPKETENNN